MTAGDCADSTLAATTGTNQVQGGMLDMLDVLVQH